MITENYFCVRHKNRWKPNQQLNCYSKQIHTLAHQTKYLHIEN